MERYYLTVTGGGSGSDSPVELEAASMKEAHILAIRPSTPTSSALRSVDTVRPAAAPMSAGRSWPEWGEANTKAPAALLADVTTKAVRGSEAGMLASNGGVMVPA